MRVLVTGGTNGMGKGVARTLAARPDVEVIVLGRSEERLRATVDELAAIASPERISSLRCDLTRMSDVRAAIDELRRRHDRLDAIFVNAGIGYAARRVETEDGMAPHFQVNYHSQFMLTLNLLDLLERSDHGGRVVFNATESGAIGWDDLQMEKKWDYETAIHQAMVAKRMFYMRLHALYASRPEPRVSCFGFQIKKTVWSNQLNIIPLPMKAMATVMKWLGQFISIDECGAIMAPLFTDGRAKTEERSGRFLSWTGGEFYELEEDPAALDTAQWERLWNVSLELCDDEDTSRQAQRLLASA
jgi:NAD(P)-dependent dehydrogenase (short-subunit alcohol dehydrogenase family)